MRAEEGQPEWSVEVDMLCTRWCGRQCPRCDIVSVVVQHVATGENWVKGAGGLSVSFITTAESTVTSKSSVYFKQNRLRCSQ